MRELYLLSFRVGVGGVSTAMEGGDWTASDIDARTVNGTLGRDPLWDAKGLTVAHEFGANRAACMVPRELNAVVRDGDEEEGFGGFRGRGLVFVEVFSSEKWQSLS